jgi:phosphopantothenoylcysteine decarboxylase / phosphopantothenate---cysteine ligase
VGGFMKILITAGPTFEPIDPVRFIGNRSSGKMGAALAAAGVKAGHSVTVILGPVAVPMPGEVRRVDVRTAAQMLEATLKEFAGCDLLILAAAVADFTPKTVHTEKIAREGTLFIECQATEDIAAAAGRVKQAHQRSIGFSLDVEGNLDRAIEKLRAKKLDLIVFNTLSSLESQVIQPTLVYPNGRLAALASASKSAFADILLERARELW